MGIKLIKKPHIIVLKEPDIRNNVIGVPVGITTDTKEGVTRAGIETLKAVTFHPFTTA